MLLLGKMFLFPDEPSLFQRTELNGQLLCVLCHRQFDALKRYVDVVDGNLVVKVNDSNDTTN